MSQSIVVVGESICGGNCEGALVTSPDQVFLRGYNTVSGKDPCDSALSVEGTGEIIAAVNGLVEITDRVVSVKGRLSRYMPEIGDIIVGRITEVAGNKWLVDINSSQSGIMLLSNVTEPGGMLRRRERGDELSMRQLFDQSDLVVAEVQRVSAEGVASLHTRAAEKYGKLVSFGRLVSVNPSLIKRSKHQFVSLPQYQCTLIIGINGNVWVSWQKAAQPCCDGGEDSLKDHRREELDNDARHNIARISNCLVALNTAGVQIFPNTIEAAVEASLAAGWSSFDILLPANLETLVARVQDTIGLKRPRAA